MSASPSTRLRRRRRPSGNRSEHAADFFVHRAGSVGTEAVPPSAPAKTPSNTSRDWRESSDVPLAKMATTVERDELGDSEMGYYFLQQICSDPRGRELAQRLLAKWYPAALDMFGRSDSPSVRKFIRWGLKTIGNADPRPVQALRRRQDHRARSRHPR
jgi:hypothetical protein